MHHRRHRLRLRSITVTDKKLSVKFDFNDKEKYKGSSEEKQKKYDILKSINKSKKIHRHTNKKSDQTLNKSQVSLLEQAKNQITYSKNLNDSKIKNNELQLNNNSNCLNSNISNQYISNIFELTKNNVIDEKAKDPELKLPDEKEKTVFFNLGDSFTFSDSDSFMYNNYFNIDDQSNENFDYFNTFLF